MDRLIRHRITIHFLLLMLLGQFIGTAWSCSMEAETASLSVSLHDEHRAHMRTSGNIETFHNSSLSDEPVSIDIAPCCGDDDSTCPTHHCSALNLTYRFEAQETPLADKLQPLAYISPIKRAPSALYRPPSSLSLWPNYPAHIYPARGE